MEGEDAMPSSAERRRLTYDDFLLFPDDGQRHELIDGEHYVTPCPNTRHQELTGRLHLALGNYLATRRYLGRVFFAPFDIIFTKFDVVEPDLVFIGGDQLDILTEQNVQGPPALVVEIQSPSTRRRDETLKRQLFERGGVREYWLVDPDHNTIRVFRRSASGELSLVADLDAHAELTSPLFPDFTLPLSECFADW